MKFNTLNIETISRIKKIALSKKTYSLILGGLLLSGCYSNQTNNNVIDNNKPNEQSTTNSETNLLGAVAAKADNNLTISEMLLYAIQDEYLAHAEYDYILSTFGSQNPFSNIIKSEETHISLLEPLLEKYYQVPENNFDEYVPHPETITVALETGVTAEINNIDMYDYFLTKDLPDDVRDVFLRLRDASINHLDSFQKKLSRS